MRPSDGNTPARKAREAPRRSTSSPDLTGRSLGDFEVERLLGHGGMGEVYLARQRSLDRPVALKVLRSELLSNPTYRARFEAEAWAAAKLNHPNIVHIYALETVDDIRFIAMEYVQGTNLREYLVRKGTVPLPLAYSIMRQATTAVGAAGEVGLVHRDIKPENLLITRKGEVKVADFGLCRAPDADRLHLTAPGMTLGTPIYMSPEQIQGRELDHRSDLYSLGVTFYHLLAGFPPFQAETPLALAMKHVNELPVDLSIRRPDLPRPLSDLVMKLLAKAPDDRYATARDVLRDLSKARDLIQSASGNTTGRDTQPALTIESPTLAQADEVDEADEAEDDGVDRPSFRLPGLSLGRGTLVLSGFAGLLIGGALGWFARPDDVLGRNVPAQTGMPGLWMAPWERTPLMGSAAAQYRLAQTRSREDERLAAWLAVPAHYAAASEWVAQSYVQVARHLFRQGDAERLRALGEELSVDRDQARLLTLGRIVLAAEAALRDDAQGVDEQFQGIGNVDRLDPADAELCFEVVNKALTLSSGRGTVGRRLEKLRSDLTGPLRITDPLLRTLDVGG